MSRDTIIAVCDSSVGSAAAPTSATRRRRVPAMHFHVYRIMMFCYSRNGETYYYVGSSEMNSRLSQTKREKP